MDVLNTKTRLTSRKPARLLAALVLLASVAMLGGCAATEEKIKTDGALSTQPVIDARLAKEDFAFPPHPLPLSQGKRVFEQNCMSCHAVSYWRQPGTQRDLAYVTPIDMYLFLTTGKAPAVSMPNNERRQVLPSVHPGEDGQPMEYWNKLSRDERWATIFYTRYLAGAVLPETPVNREKEITVFSVFGGNCAVCHGTRGQADGPLHIGKTGNHELHDAPLKHALLPAPANFQEPRRILNRTDAQLFKYICEGIYPSAMPSWYGNVRVDRDEAGRETVLYRFDDELILHMVRYIRSLSYVNDLTDEAGETPQPPAGLTMLEGCQAVPTNRPWTETMRGNVPSGLKAMPAQPKDVHDVTGGMTFQSRTGKQPVIRRTPADEGGRSSQK